MFWNIFSIILKFVLVKVLILLSDCLTTGLIRRNVQDYPSTVTQQMLGLLLLSKSGPSHAAALRTYSVPCWHHAHCKRKVSMGLKVFYGTWSSSYSLWSFSFQVFVAFFPSSGLGCFPLFLCSFVAHSSQFVCSPAWYINRYFCLYYFLSFYWIFLISICRYFLLSYLNPKSLSQTGRGR